MNRKRHGIIQYLNHIEQNLIRDWSLQRSPENYDSKPFHELKLRDLNASMPMVETEKIHNQIQK